jgi:glutamate 5-kinase
VANKGIRVVIANGNRNNILVDLIERPMETMHTEFVPKPKKEQ